jgi:hypothetical protein
MWTAGQAVVQLAKHRINDLEYAIKFYLSHTAFQDEANLFLNDGNPLGQFLPEVRDIVSNADGSFVDAFGAPMPACISMEKGESLDIWSSRNGNGIDMITGLQVRFLVVLLSDYRIIRFQYALYASLMDA